MAVKCVWDTTAADSTSGELTYFAALGFAVPVVAGRICALPLENMCSMVKELGPFSSITSPFLPYGRKPRDYSRKLGNTLGNYIIMLL